MEDGSVKVADSFRLLKKERNKELRESISLLKPHNLASRESVYYLLEPDSDTIRYIGICSSPMGRFSAHIHSAKRAKSAHLPVARWIASLIERGTLPRMWVIAEIITHSWRVDSNVNCYMAAGAVEKTLISGHATGRYCGSGHLESNLLNVSHMPDIFLSNGLDVAKDHL